MSDRESLVEDLLRELLYATVERYDEVVEAVREEGSVVRIRLRGHTHDFEISFERGEERQAVFARLERKLRIAREGPDRTRPPIEG